MQEALDEGACRELLAERLPGLPEELVTALIRLAGGDPDVLTELAGMLTPGQIRGSVPPPCTLPLTSRLGRACRAAVAGLPGPARHALLLAAADPDLTAGELLAATGEQDLVAAEQACLVTVTPTGVQFLPAVLRAVVYYDAPHARRRAAHLDLAELLGRRGERLRALVHRAAAAAGSDERLARELFAAAADGPARTASAAYRYAAELTTAADFAVEALAAAARQAWLAGERQQARLLLRRAGRSPQAPAHAHARSLAGEMDLRQGDAATARDTLLSAAAELSSRDLPAALEALLLAGEAVHLAGGQGGYCGLARRILARRTPDAPDPVAQACHQVAGLAAMYEGDHDAAFAHLRDVLRTAPAVADPVALIRAANAAVLLGDGPAARVLAGRAVELAGDRGAVTLVPQGLEVAAFAGLAAGHHDVALAAATEGAALARATGQPALAQSHLGILAVLAALVGDRDTCVLRIRAAGVYDSAKGPGQARAFCEWALALLDLVEGRPRAALHRLDSIFVGPAGRGSLVVQVAAAPHLIEAYWRCDPPPHTPPAARTAVLDGVFEPFDRWAAGTGQPYWLALRARCRALRATDPRAAEEYFQEALREHRRGDADFARAHTELLYGRDLRRRRRPGAAREHLRRAEETFRLLDAAPWAAQADVELRAAGAAVPPRPVAAARGLTAQQERIARLVADGATNREVAEQLFLSPRTIDHHLRNVFARLGVRSRTELARLMG
ncbi:LuxR C-terminal-related transcriptional regulator [Actinoplanes sp. NPDC049668]|uniref:LuxR C-terminal-related transcriptional regulator n=1 Tax=unclassified Actinoplanes TaxID=2626549 RepID=UPI0033BCACA6